VTGASSEAKIERIIGRIMEQDDLDRTAARTQLHKYVCGGRCHWFQSRTPPERFERDLTPVQRAQIDEIVADILPGLSEDEARREIHAVLCHPLPEPGGE
jgi:hypothetical protein